jgi:hypothetical protein
MRSEATDGSDPGQGEMETLSAVMGRLGEAGYRVQFVVSDDSVICQACGTMTEPELLAVHEVFRFEGMSDPDDESVLFALQGSCGHRGTLVAAYGPDTTADEAAVLRRLPKSAD